MLVHPNFDPVAIHLGPVGIRWYGLSYLAGFIGFWYLSKIRGRWSFVNWTSDQISDALFYGVLGVVLGGRIGYTFFYNFDDHGQLIVLHDPLVLFRIWEGGMSFHGGLLGVLVSALLYARHRGISFWQVTDFIAVTVPVGLFTGRIGNFINGELWGAPTTLPWGMVFQHAPDKLPRHPSMLYEAFLEGLVMLAVLWWFGRKPRPRMAISGLFLLLYGSFRFAVEFVREPDQQLGYLYGTHWFTMGMQLCVPMLVAGAMLMTLAYRNKRMD